MADKAKQFDFLGGRACGARREKCAGWLCAVITLALVIGPTQSQAQSTRAMGLLPQNTGGVRGEGGSSLRGLEPAPGACAYPSRPLRQPGLADEIDCSARGSDAFFCASQRTALQFCCIAWRVGRWRLHSIAARMCSGANPYITASISSTLTSSRRSVPSRPAPRPRRLSVPGPSASSFSRRLRTASGPHTNTPGNFRPVHALLQQTTCLQPSPLQISCPSLLCHGAFQTTRASDRDQKN